MTQFRGSKADVLNQEYLIPANDGGRVQLPQYTTAERNALTALEGEIIYNATTNKLNFYNGVAWEAVTSA